MCDRCFRDREREKGEGEIHKRHHHFLILHIQEFSLCEPSDYTTIGGSQVVHYDLLPHSGEIIHARGGGGE